MPKCDKVESERRVRIVQEWILQGYATSDIVAQLERTFNISQRQAYKYYRKAFEEFKKSNVSSIEEKRAYHLALRRKLLKGLKEQDTPRGARAALRIADSMARIDGIAVSTQNNFPNADSVYENDETGGVAIMKLPDGREIEI